MLSLSLYAKYNFGVISQTLKLFLLMFAMLTFSIVDVQGQRIRYGYEWPCLELSVPPVITAPIPEIPTLCEKNPFKDAAQVISIGKGGKYPTSADLIKGLAAQTINGRDILIVGDFVVNESIVFRACKVKVVKDKSIIVNAENHFRSLGSKFFSCSDMWNGIYVNDDASLTLLGNTQIEDAYKAVYATDLVNTLRISNTTFNRDQIGCYFESKNGGILPLTLFYGNTFSCTSKLNIQKGYQWTLDGVFTNNISIPTLGTPGTTTNLYTGKITNGVEITNNSIVAVAESKFVRIDSDNATLPDAQFANPGYGIKSKDSNLKVVGLGGDKKASNFEYTFNNNAGGSVYSDASSVDVSQCGTRTVIEDNKSADKTENPQPNDIFAITNNKKVERISITNNYFFVWNGTGIVVVDKSNGRTNTISENTFDFNADKALTIFPDVAKMIVLNNANTEYARNSYLAFPPSNGNIFGNTFNSILHSQKFDGITLNGGIATVSEKLTVNNNVGRNKFNDFCGNNAITLNKTSKTRVSQNNIAGYTTGVSVAGIGVYVNGTLSNPSAFNVICVNAVDYTDVNFRFDGVCSENKFSRNLIYRSKTAGLFLRSNDVTNALPMYEAVIGTQFQTKADGAIISYVNEWLYNTKSNPVLKPKYDALFSGAAKPQGPVLNVLASQFKIDIAKAKYPDAPEVITVPLGVAVAAWFAPLVDLIETSPGCEGKPIEKVSSDIGDKWNTLDESILQGEYGSNYAVTDWEAKRFLYKRMLAFPAILEDDEKRITFYKTMQGTNVEKYTQIKNALDRSFDIDNSDAEKLDELLEKQTLITNTMSEYLASMGAQYGNEQDLPSFVHDVIKVKSEELSGVNTQLQGIRSNVDKKRMATLEDLYAQSESLEPSNEYEKDYKTVYSLWLKAAIQNGRLDDKDLAKLRKIARKCITESGSAVWYARDLLPNCERSLYPDDYNCSDIDIRPISKVVKNNTTSVVYPTPVDNILYLSLYDFEKASKLNITDVNGRTVLTSKIERANNQIAVSNLENGMYLIHIQDNDGNTLKTEKIIVQH